MTGALQKDASIFLLFSLNASPVNCIKVLSLSTTFFHYRTCMKILPHLQREDAYTALHPAMIKVYNIMVLTISKSFDQFPVLVIKMYKTDGMKHLDIKIVHTRSEDLYIMTCPLIMIFNL